MLGYLVEKTLEKKVELREKLGGTEETALQPYSLAACKAHAMHDKA